MIPRNNLDCVGHISQSAFLHNQLKVLAESPASKVKYNPVDHTYEPVTNFVIKYFAENLIDKHDAMMDINMAIEELDEHSCLKNISAKVKQISSINLTHYFSNPDVDIELSLIGKVRFKWLPLIDKEVIAQKLFDNIIEKIISLNLWHTPRDEFEKMVVDRLNHKKDIVFKIQEPNENDILQFRNRGITLKNYRDALYENLSYLDLLVDTMDSIAPLDLLEKRDNLIKLFKLSWVLEARGYQPMSFLKFNALQRKITEENDLFEDVFSKIKDAAS